jgi:hypothetical protein
MLALAHDNLGELDLTDRAYDDAIAAYEAVGDALAVGIMQSNQAVIRYIRGDDHAGARQLAVGALDLQLAGGHAWGLAIARNSVGRIAVASGDDDEALRQYAANVLASNDHGDKTLLFEAVYWICVIAQSRGLSRPAARLLGAAATAEARFGLEVTRNRTSLQAFQAAAEQAATDLGAADFERAYAEGRTLSLGAIAQEALTLGGGVLTRTRSEEN